MSKNIVLKGNLQDTHIVQKCEPMLLMRTVPFELGELKILDTYLSRINSHDSNCRTVTFTKSEYEELMGFKNADIRTLKKYTKSMLSKVIELPMPDGYIQFTLFTKSVCKKNEYDQQIIELTCSEDAKTIFFNIEKLGYLRYELKNILTLTSKYSFLLYLYLLKNRYRADWIIPLQELREQYLDVKNSDYYKEFKRFNNEILKKAVKEVNEKTDIKFSYENKKTGRRITDIRFQLIQEFNEVETNQLSFGNENHPEDTSDIISLLSDACNNEFSSTQIEEIFQNICNLKLQENEFGIDIARYHYVSKMYSKLNSSAERAIAKGKPIKDRYKYFLALIQKQ